MSANRSDLIITTIMFIFPCRGITFMNFVFLCCIVLSIFHNAVTDFKERQCPELDLPFGKVKVRSRGRVAKFRCDPLYQLVGNKTATCIEGVWDASLPLCIKNNCRRISKSPKNGYWIEQYKGASYTLICNTGYALQGTRTIYCQNGKWSDTIPFCTEVNTSCDFEEESLCGWRQDKNNHFNWTRHSKETPSSYLGTGPTYDHTFGEYKNGHYMYIESSGAEPFKDTARLLSPVYGFQYSEDACFIFYYHMYGSTTGELNVYQQFPSAGAEYKTRLFHKSGDQGNQWHMGFADLIKQNLSFQIVIEAVRGWSYMSDIAIDDLKLMNGKECENATIPPIDFPSSQVMVMSTEQTTMPRQSSIHSYLANQSTDSHRRQTSNFSIPYEQSQLPTVTTPVKSVETIQYPTERSMKVTRLTELFVPGDGTYSYNTSTFSSSFKTPASEISQTVSLGPFTTQNNTYQPISKASQTSHTTQTISSSTYPYTSNLPFFYISNVTSHPTLSYPPRTTSVSSHSATKLTTYIHKTTSAIDKSINIVTKPMTITTATTIFKMSNRRIPSSQAKTTTTVSAKSETSLKYWKATTKSSNIKRSTNMIVIDLPSRKNKTARYDNLYPLKQSHKMTQEISARASKESKAAATNSHVTYIAGAAGGIAILAITCAVLVFIITRHYLKFKKQSDFSEDSDVRFLTSDEVLDFSLARPSDEEDN